VTESDAFVTIDIGHAHAVRHLHSQKEVFEEYILPHRDRLLNAHVYHTELEGYGHVPPADLTDISDQLDLLGLADSCDWWVIELMKPSELLHTRDLLENYLETSSLQTVAVPQQSPFPLGAI
jgi:hypothetical protein